MLIEKRDGKKEPLNLNKITNAVSKAFKSVNKFTPENIRKFVNNFDLTGCDTVEKIQDRIESTLMDIGFSEVAKSFIIYRKNRENIRNSKNHLNKVFKEILNSESDLIRENANINGESPMGLMLLFGSEMEKDYVKNFLISKKFVEEHERGDFHIHDLNMYACCFNCCHIDLSTMFKHGFSTGHGYLREPKSIQTATAQAAIIIQSNQNDMFGGQGIPMFEYNLAPYVAKSFSKRLKECAEIIRGVSLDNGYISEFIDNLYKTKGSVLDNLNDVKRHFDSLLNICSNENLTDKIVDKAVEMTDKDTYQAMEAFIHNMNTLHSRAGSQTPFSSINYGTGTTGECRMIIKNILKATDSGMGHHETPIFPIQIFKIKEGVNALPGDPNYDLYKYACTITPKRFYPNYVNIDVPYNLQYYRPGKPETEMATMGCRTRVIGQLGTSEGSVQNRGNIAFTTLNLPRIALRTKSLDEFFKEYDSLITDAIDELLERVKFIAKKKVYNFPFLMGEGLYMGSEKLRNDDCIESALKNGTLSVGFCGLAECLKALTGKHHGESKESYELGLKIIQHMRDRTDEATQKYGWYFSTFATPAESTAGRFLKIDRNEFGIIEGVTDRDFYTNSFHIPVYFNITAFDKMRLEGKFHEICNAGAITYVELDGDAVKNSEVVKKLADFSRKCGISYFSINTIHDVCPICGFDGIINSDVCPNCGWHEGSEISIEELKQKGIKIKY